jgi:hypothetical protein
MTGNKRQQRFHGRVADAGRPCEAPGCPEPGEFRAPRSNRGETGDAARDWRWFCLDHVREFNASYNFYDGMTPDEIAAAQTPHPSWDRGTRPFASNANVAGDAVADPLGILSGRYGVGAFARASAKNGKPVSAKDRRALSVLQLDAEATFADIRARYKDLVRRYHPDSNGGDRAHEGKLQDVIDAYTHLKSAPAFSA